jgi:ferredoxin-nitrate reductase
MPIRWDKRWLYENLSFPTDSGKAKMYPASYKHKESTKFILTTGRTKNQWYTMTRTGKSPELLKNEEEPFLLMNQEDALELRILENETVEVISENGKIQLKVRFGDIKRKHLFAPFGYEKINELLGDDTDPLSKEPELKFMEVELKSHGK